MDDRTYSMPSTSHLLDRGGSGWLLGREQETIGMHIYDKIMDTKYTHFKEAKCGIKGIKKTHKMMVYM